MNPKIFSFFSGAGFLDLGFETEGYKVVHVNENHAPFLGAYQYSRKPFGIENPEYGYCPNSVTDYLNECHSRRLQETLVDSKKDGSLAGFIGGPPCPDFSIAGKNRGHEGERGQLSRTDGFVAER